MQNLKSMIPKEYAAICFFRFVDYIPFEWKYTSVVLHWFIGDLKGRRHIPNGNLILLKRGMVMLID